MKQFVALARVSSREQEREGFSLEVQEDALRRYATAAGGEILRLFRIAETASKTSERKTFKELIAYAKQHAGRLDGLLFYKVDRAARNLFDYVELERLESEHGLPFISVSQPTDSNPAGRMMRRTLANMASFYTEQQSVDVREGHARRVQEAANVRRMFELFAFEPLTLDALVDRMHAEGRTFRKGTPKFPRSSVHNILLDRAYIGELEYKGQWYPGKHEPLVDRGTWNRVQALLGGKTYKAHQLTYAGGLIRCGHCGNLITGEHVVKASTGKAYVYYRCTVSRLGDHPRTRVTERELDVQILSVFRSIRQPEEVRQWFAAALRQWSQGQRQGSQEHAQLLQRDLAQLRQQQDRLLNLRLADEINADVFAAKKTELRDRIAAVTLQIEVVDRDRGEQGDLAIKVFELSQALEQRWLAAGFAEKRKLLELVFSNFRLVDVSLCYETNKPFDVLVEGLSVPSHRGDRI